MARKRQSKSQVEDFLHDTQKHPALIAVLLSLVAFGGAAAYWKFAESTPRWILRIIYFLLNNALHIKDRNVNELNVMELQDEPCRCWNKWDGVDAGEDMFKADAPDKKNGPLPSFCQIDGTRKKMTGTDMYNVPWSKWVLTVLIRVQLERLTKREVSGKVSKTVKFLAEVRAEFFEKSYLDTQGEEDIRITTTQDRRVLKECVYMKNAYIATAVKENNTSQLEKAAANFFCAICSVHKILKAVERQLETIEQRFDKVAEGYDAIRNRSRDPSQNAEEAAKEEEEEVAKLNDLAMEQDTLREDLAIAGDVIDDFDEEEILGDNVEGDGVADNGEPAPNINGEPAPNIVVMGWIGPLTTSTQRLALNKANKLKGIYFNPTKQGLSNSNNKNTRSFINLNSLKKRNSNLKKKIGISELERFMAEKERIGVPKKKKRDEMDEGEEAEFEKERIGVPKKKKKDEIDEEAERFMAEQETERQRQLGNKEYSYIRKGAKRIAVNPYFAKEPKREFAAMETEEKERKSALAAGEQGSGYTLNFARKTTRRTTSTTRRTTSKKR